MNGMFDSFADCPEILARSDDPETSHIAARAASHFIGEHHRMILEALKKLGTGTAIEIGKETGLGKQRAGRRLAELVRAGRISVLEGVTRPSDAGRPMRVFRLNRRNTE